MMKRPAFSTQFCRDCGPMSASPGFRIEKFSYNPMRSPLASRRRTSGSTMKLRLSLLSLLAIGVGVSAATPAETLYGATFDNQLVSFDSSDPSLFNSAIFLNGLVGGENVAGISFRPTTGQLYVVGTSSRLYTVNLVTGDLTQVGSGRFSPVISGTSFGDQFNPVADTNGLPSLRFVTDTRQNLRINANTGAVLVDGTINYTDATSPNPQVTDVAYTNSFAGATTTVPYGLETLTNNLVRFTNINAGQMVRVGSLGNNFSGLNGFDISGQTGIAYASLQVVGQSSSELYTINLATGLATSVGVLGAQGSNVQFRGLAVLPAPVPEPASIAVFGVGLVALLRRKRR